jgi:hypothetical protein
MERTVEMRHHTWILLLAMMTLTAGMAEAPPAPDAPAIAEPSTLPMRLDAALDDERHAFAFYRAVMAKHGERRPFSNIIRAEQRHESALLRQYQRLGLTPPANRWTAHAFDVPATFAAACDASVVA